jgi:hypothetical protein
MARIFVLLEWCTMSQKNHLVSAAHLVAQLQASNCAEAIPAAACLGQRHHAGVSRAS